MSSVLYLNVTEGVDGAFLNYWKITMSSVLYLNVTEGVDGAFLNRLRLLYKEREKK